MPTGHQGRKTCSDRCPRNSKTKIRQNRQCNKLGDQSKEKDIECNLRLKISTERGTSILAFLLHSYRQKTNLTLTLNVTLEGQIHGKMVYGRPKTMFLDWLLKRRKEISVMKN